MEEKAPTPQGTDASEAIPGKNAEDEYGADKIKVLEGLEAVRVRPAAVRLCW